MFNHTQCGRSCACAVACLHPHNSISNVVVSLTIHDNIKIYFYINVGDVAKNMKLLWKVINVYMCAYTYIFFHTDTRIHIHVQVHVRVRVRVRVRVSVFVLACCCCCRCGFLWMLCVVVVVVEEGEEGGEKPNHVTTDSLRSVPQDC